MKARFSQQRNHALTFVEVLMVIFVSTMAAVWLLSALAAAKKEQRRTSCVSNLKQVGIAFRLWEGDNNGKYPMLVSMTNGGAMELVATGNVAACFRVMSNELSIPIILHCPQDTHQTYATNFSSGFNNTKISYFIGADVADEAIPQMLLSGDDNFAVSGVPIKSGMLQLLANTPVTWTGARHKFAGNIGLADGSVQQVATEGLQKALQQTGVATNRLVLP